MINFDDEEISKINKNIAKIIVEISSQLQQGEKLIKEFSKEMTENPILKSIQKNMQISLVNKL